MLFGLLGNTTPRYAGVRQPTASPDAQGLLGSWFGAVTPGYGGGGQPTSTGGSSGWWGCPTPGYQQPPVQAPAPAEPPPEACETDEGDNGGAGGDDVPSPTVRIIVLPGEGIDHHLLSRLQDYLLDQ